MDRIGSISMSDLPRTKRRSGIPTGNAGEYFVMGELLRRGFDAQLADRNTKGYDILVGEHDAEHLQKVQVKTVRAAPWYVNQSSFKDKGLDQITVYVLLGPENSKASVRYFIARNRDLEPFLYIPKSGSWTANAFMRLQYLLPHEGQWALFSKDNN